MTIAILVVSMASNNFQGVTSMSIYCTYLTTYFGSKLPMFYIGSTSVHKVLNENYRGSVSSKKYKDTYKSELKQNPQLFKTKILRTFDSRNEAISHELKLQKYLNMPKSPMYINLTYANGKFGMDITGKNNPFYGKQHSSKTKIKISKSKIGNTDQGNSAFGHTVHDETRLKLKLANIGKLVSEETKLKMKSSHMGFKHNTITCPHCNKSGGDNIMHRYHFDNCKFKI